MSEKRTYKVAGYVFSIQDSCGSGLLGEMSNLAPFVCGEQDGERLFDLEIVPELPDRKPEFMHRTDDGPDFPEITIFTAEGGWLVRVRPLPHLPEASVMWISSDFSRASMQILESRDRHFPLNNALMLMYAFSTANRGILEMHSSVVMNGGKGYLFLGKSGTGKSTHPRLWLENIPGSELLNDDNPILRLMPDGSARVYGSPWSGKTPCYKAKDVPAGAVVLLRQAPFNKIERLPMLRAYATLMSSASSFRPFSDLAGGWHRTIEGLVAAVPCYTLDCLPDRAAAELSYNTIHG